ncbi:MAG: polynucleotide adenylyltransferase PcnB [Proteobacteria bacterium]|nr:polynucleotide adenylyltransferase PcnB [Pseudomonadota bacterium]
MDEDALDVIQQLNANGYTALLVGGCIRDALCGMRPKDFDVATDAPLDEVKRIFRRSRIVGRRFPIAHVRYGRNLIEVSTFRQSVSDNIEHDDQGMILRDQAFGTLQEDAFRRDFSINALYFDPNSREIIDYVGGLDDLAAGRVNLIGDPAVRLAEDPVRMLRAVRFANKLDFNLDPQIVELIEDSAHRLAAIPPARLFDEFLKLFLTGYGEGIWNQIRHTGIARALLPTCNPDSSLVLAAMRNTDSRIKSGLSVTPGFLVAVLLWEDFNARYQEKTLNDDDPAFATLRNQQQTIAIPRRFGTFAKETWMTQDRLIKRNPRTIARLIQHKRFRAGFDFLCLRAETEVDLTESAEWWSTFQEQDETVQQQMIAELPKPQRKRRRRNKRKTAE